MDEEQQREEPGGLPEEPGGLEAVRLARILRRLLPAERETAGLLALLLLVHARRDARTAGSRRRSIRARRTASSARSSRWRRGPELAAYPSVNTE
ncbi:DUF6596 domain-containing protein [Streptomyces globisporus]|uniref:DUF6596 domain-containing protein n=1 Tax=Streptomyces globisporus TaxID=1908 RepID=UPI003CC80D1C